MWIELKNKYDVPTLINLSRVDRIEKCEDVFQSMVFQDTDVFVVKLMYEELKQLIEMSQVAFPR